MESYQQLAQVYDELMISDIKYEEWFQNVSNFFRNNNIFPKNILEMACGTGNFTKYLCENGYNVTCFDLSEDMLSVAFDKLNQYKNVSILKQDMVTFQIDNVFDVIFSVCDSINYIIDEKDLLKIFLNVYNHLNDGGLFIFDISSYYKLKNIIGNNTFVYDSDRIFYVWENSFDEQNNVCEFLLTFFIKENKKYTRFDEYHLQKAYNVEEIESYLKKANFRVINVYDGYSFKLPRETSERICFVALK